MKAQEIMTYKSGKEKLAEENSRVDVLGVGVDNCTFIEARRKIEALIVDGRPAVLTFINAETIMMARRYPEYMSHIDSSKLVLADGMGVAWASRLLANHLSETVCAVDMLYSLCEASVDKGYGIYLLGGQPGVAEKACRNLKELYPGVNITGFHHGYLPRNEEKLVVEDIREKRPDILVVCLGMYAQEMWIRRHLDELGVPVCWGSGGTLDMVSGKLKRAPSWVHKAGLEWCYRLMLEPWRIKRQHVLPLFVLKVAIQKIKGRPALKH